MIDWTSDLEWIATLITFLLSSSTTLTILSTLDVMAATADTLIMGPLFEMAESLLGLTTQLLEGVSESLDPFVGTDTLPGIIARQWEDYRLALEQVFE